MAENIRSRTPSKAQLALEDRYRSGDLAKMKCQPPTSYGETILHLFKGNVGTGCYAMAEAVKNSGIIFGPLMIVLIAIICVHVQHILIACATEMQDRFQMKDKPDYAQTVEMCFASNQKWSKGSRVAKAICNVFICITQLGFCSVYLLFFGTNLQNVLSYYGYNYSVAWLVAIILIPIILTSMITNLKYIAPCSLIATIFMVTGIIITFYYILQDLPPISDRTYVAPVTQWPLFFGTVLFAFEGIALVLPLQNSMKIPSNFTKTFGVLNIGMVVVTLLYVLTGFLGFLKYGEASLGSLTLNVPQDEILAQCLKLMIATGVGLGYCIQLFVPVQILYPKIKQRFKLANEHPYVGELIFRVILVLFTFVVAEAVPDIGLLLSLIGAIACTVLALVFPPILEFTVKSNDGLKLSYFVIIKNSIILLFAAIGCVTGGYEAIINIIN
ncbi:unnamed protein product [Diamesa serratosioi]